MISAREKAIYDRTEKLRAFTVPLLKEEAKALGLPVSGKSKNDLIAAIIEAEDQKEANGTKTRRVEAHDKTMPTPEEAEAQAGEPTPAPPEVRPDEFRQGTGPSVGASRLATEVVEALRKPLSPDRVRTRSGRGGGKFEYIAGHDAKRRANELFGFGNWGSELIEMHEEAAVPVVNSNGKDGWHICYRAVVRVTVRDCLPVSDVGYGDGVEYGPAALATARELAMKEAVTDAMKRALTQYGDQFGLILYAKVDEKKRIDREAAAAESQRPEYRQEDAGRGIVLPKSWAEIGERLNRYGPGDVYGWGQWLDMASEHLYGLSAAELDRETRGGAFFQKAQQFVIALEEAHSPDMLPPLAQAEIATVWASVLEGTLLEPPVASAEAGLLPVDPEAEDIPFGGPVGTGSGYDG